LYFKPSIHEIKIRQAIILNSNHSKLKIKIKQIQLILSLMQHLLNTFFSVHFFKRLFLLFYEIRFAFHKHTKAHWAELKKNFTIFALDTKIEYRFEFAYINYSDRFAFEKHFEEKHKIIIGNSFFSVVPKKLKTKIVGFTTFLLQSKRWNVHRFEWPFFLLPKYRAII